MYSTWNWLENSIENWGVDMVRVDRYPRARVLCIPYLDYYFEIIHDVQLIVSYREYMTDFIEVQAHQRPSKTIQYSVPSTDTSPQKSLS